MQKMNYETADVSLFRTHISRTPSAVITLEEWLCSTPYGFELQQILHEPNEVQQLTLKNALPSITPGGICDCRHYPKIVKPSGFVSISIPAYLNPKAPLDEIYTHLKQKPFVYFIGYSADHRHLECIIPIPLFQNHRKYMNTVAHVLSLDGIKIDMSDISLERRMCTPSHFGIFINREAIPVSVNSRKDVRSIMFNTKKKSDSDHPPTHEYVPEGTASGHKVNSLLYLLFRNQNIVFCEEDYMTLSKALNRTFGIGITRTLMKRINLLTGSYTDDELEEMILYCSRSCRAHTMADFYAVFAKHGLTV